MADYHDLVQALTFLLVNKLQSKSEYTRGLLGNGQGQVEVPNRPDYSFVRPDRFTTRVAEIFNKLVGGPDGLPVVLGELPWQAGLTQVLSVDWDTYLGVGWGDATPGIAQHGQTHELRDAAPGVDSFNVWRRQLGELRTYPVGSGSTSVFVSPYNFTHIDGLKSWSGLPGFDLSEAVPGTTGTARMALVYWDPCSGTAGWLGVATGTLGVDSEPEILDRPASPPGTIPTAYVRLAGGQGSVTEFDIWDARPLWQPSLEFATGSCGIWAGIIPIGDPGNNFTGTTVEAALEEIVDSGGGPPSGPAGGDLTGTYPNPIVDGLLGRPLGLDPVDEYFMLMFTGSAWQPVPGPFKLVAPDGAPDPALFSDNSGNIVGVKWIAGDATGFIVENRASGTVTAGELGFIDETGVFARTATEFADVAWAVVLQGGGHQQDIYVARRGEVSVKVDGNNNDGDFIFTSTTAGQGTSLSTMRPEVCGVVIPGGANASGAGGTCEALLYCHTKSVVLSSAIDVYSINPTSDSDWRTTINGAPVGAVVTYTAPLTSGAEDSIVPTATNLFGKIRLYNETRSDYALIDDVDTGANTITLTAAAPGAWANTDVITTRSQTCVNPGAPPYFYDVDLSSADNTLIPKLARAIDLDTSFRDTAAANKFVFHHPWEAHGGSKVKSVANAVANLFTVRAVSLPLIQQRFCLLYDADGVGTAAAFLRLNGWQEAAP